MAEEYIVTSIQETDEVATKLISSISSGITICLYGPMAAGKTTFTQSIGKYLGLSRVTSPTYLIMKEYKIDNHPIFKSFYHLDLYRLHSAEEIKSFDLEEIWNGPQNLLIIEWPEIIKHLLPDKRIDIAIKIASENEREITIIKNT